MTAMHYVLRNFKYDKFDNLDFIQWLFDRGASPNIPNAFGDTAVHVAFKLHQAAEKKIIDDKKLKKGKG